MRLRAFPLLFLLAAPAVAAPPPVLDVDRIVAVVNNDVITETELDARLDETRRSLASQQIRLPPDDVLRRQLLERMIIERVQVQLASQTGIHVTDQDVDNALETIASRNKMTVEKLYATVTREGLDRAAYREQVKNQILIQQLVDREITSRVTVTESEVANLLEGEQQRTRADEEYNISHIYIAVPETAATEQVRQAKARADQVLRELREGGDFGQAAVSYSQGPDALKGGSIGWRNSGQLPELFVAALERMQPGEISGVLRGPNGFHILKLNDRRGKEGAQAVTQTHVRHILLKPSEIQSAAEARSKLEELRDRIAAGEDFGELARTYSEDTVSAAKGGDLGWVAPKQLVPEFEGAMNGLATNQLSDPVQTPFGLHLIQVLGRRQQDVSEERARQAARSQIHARKADDRYAQWVRQLRDEAYVEYLLDEVN